MMTTNRTGAVALWLGLVVSLATVGCKSTPSATALDITVVTDSALLSQLSQVTVTVHADAAYRRTDLSNTFNPVTASRTWTVRVDNAGAGFPVIVSATGAGSSLSLSTSLEVDVTPGAEKPVTLTLSAKCAGPSAPVCAATQMCADGACVDKPVLPATDGGVDGGAGGKGAVGGAGGKAGAGGKGGGGGTPGTGGATGGSVGTGGHDAGTVTIECDAGTHNCSGMGCVSNDSVAHCGGLCGGCSAPDGGTAICGDGGICDFTCGALKKCATGCGACCSNSDCPQQNGKSGTCDTSTRTCNYTTCVTGFKPCGTGCIPTGNCCTSSECGTCESCTSGSCVAVVSHDDPVASRCAGTCDANGVCKSKLGQTCNTVPGATGGCIGGTFCAPDGYCCNSACTGSCVACDLQGFQGTCTNIGANATPHSGHSSCAGVGTTCAGACSSNGTCVYGTGSCGNAPTCSGTGYVGQGSCNNGTCVTPGVQVCSGNLVCSQNACKTGCTADADCLNGYFCEAGSCHLGAVAVTAGNVHACALLSDGSVYCWGYDYYGQLGNGQSSDTGVTQSSTPVKAILPGAASMVSANGQATCALLKTGAVYCWGSGNNGQLGYGALPTTNSGGLSTPVKVSLSGTASYVSVNYGGACAISGGSAWCWGRNVEGELGNGVFGNSAPYGSLSPVQVMGGGFPAPVILTGGYYHVCAGSNSVWCWGDDAYGQLGNNTFNNNATGYGYATPQSLYFSYPSNVTALASGFYFSCGLLSGGSVYCWGNNNSGQLGTGSFSATSPYGIDTPVQVTGTISAPQAITAGGYHACALLANGSVSCWGGNQYGELGTGTATSSSPYGIATANAVVGLGSTATAVAAGTNFTCAVLKNGSVWCWGVNTYGVLGNDSGAQSVSPLQIPGW